MKCCYNDKCGESLDVLPQRYGRRGISIFVTTRGQLLIGSWLYQVVIVFFVFTVRFMSILETNLYSVYFVCKILLTQCLEQIAHKLGSPTICSKTGFLLHVSVSVYFILLRDGTSLADIGSKRSFNLIGPYWILEIFVCCLNYSQQYSCKVFHVYRCLSYCDLASTEFLFIIFLFFSKPEESITLFKYKNYELSSIGHFRTMLPKKLKIHCFDIFKT